MVFSSVHFAFDAKEYIFCKHIFCEFCWVFQKVDHFLDFFDGLFDAGVIPLTLTRWELTGEMDPILDVARGATPTGAHRLGATEKIEVELLSRAQLEALGRDQLHSRRDRARTGQRAAVGVFDLPAKQFSGQL